MVWPIMGRQNRKVERFFSYSVGSSGPASVDDFLLSVLGGLGDPIRLKTFAPSPKLLAAAALSCSSVMFLLHTPHSSAAYAPPSACRNMLQRMTCPQHTGTHIVARSSAAIGPLAGSYRAGLYSQASPPRFAQRPGPPGNLRLQPRVFGCRSHHVSYVSPTEPVESLRRKSRCHIHHL